jgi:hypothetical protein
MDDVQLYPTFCSTSYKQYNQCYPDHKEVMVLKCIWSYLSQFLTLLDEPRAEFKVIRRVIMWNSSCDHLTSPFVVNGVVQISKTLTLTTTDQLLTVTTGLVRFV